MILKIAFACAEKLVLNIKSIFDALNVRACVRVYSEFCSHFFRSHSSHLNASNYNIQFMCAAMHGSMVFFILQIFFFDFFVYKIAYRW